MLRSEPAGPPWQRPPAVTEAGAVPSDLGVVLSTLASHTDNLAYLDEAVTLQRAAVDGTPVGRTDWQVCVARLSSALRERSSGLGIRRILMLRSRPPAKLWTVPVWPIPCGPARWNAWRRHL